jgi:hypothetical protein
MVVAGSKILILDYDSTFSLFISTLYSLLCILCCQNLHCILKEEIANSKRTVVVATTYLSNSISVKSDPTWPPKEGKVRLGWQWVKRHES